MVATPAGMVNVCSAPVELKVTVSARARAIPAAAHATHNAAEHAAPVAARRIQAPRSAPTRTVPDRWLPARLLRVELSLTRRVASNVEQ
jgi:hypothetical protein